MKGELKDKQRLRELIEYGPRQQQQIATLQFSVPGMGRIHAPASALVTSRVVHFCRQHCTLWALSEEAIAAGHDSLGLKLSVLAYSADYAHESPGELFHPD